MASVGFLVAFALISALILVAFTKVFVSLFEVKTLFVSVVAVTICVNFGFLSQLFAAHYLFRLPNPETYAFTGILCYGLAVILFWKKIR